MAQDKNHYKANVNNVTESFGSVNDMEFLGMVSESEGGFVKKRIRLCQKS